MSNLPTQRRPGKHEGELPPHDSELERYILGAVIADPEPRPLVELIVGEPETVFYDLQHRSIFRAIKDVAENGGAFDPISLSVRLDPKDNPRTYLLELQSAAPPIAGIPVWLDSLRKLRFRREMIALCQEVQENVFAGHDAGEIIPAVRRSIELMEADGAATTGRKWIAFKSPSEINSWEIPADHIIAGDCEIVRGNWTLISGHPGIGKSRALTALAVSGATGTPWFGADVPKRFRTMIIQAENGPIWLKRQLALADESFDEWIRISDPPDYGLCFSDPGFRYALSREIAAFEPHVVACDPWNAITRDATQKDFKESFDHIDEILPKGSRKPAVVIVSHTRKPSADGGGSGRALLHEVSGTHAFGARARCVYHMQAASNDTEDDRVIWSIAKNNDGEMRRRSAWHRRDGVFEPCPDFDWAAFDEDRRDSRKGRRSKYDPQGIAALLPPEGLSFGDWFDRAAEEFKIPQRSMHRVADRCISDGLTHYSKVLGVYQPVTEELPKMP